MSPSPSDTTARDVGALLREGTQVDAAVARAQADAVRRRRLLGQPVVVWRDGRAVEEPAPGGDAGDAGDAGDTGDTGDAGGAPVGSR